MELVAAIDLGGTSIKAALVDSGLRSVHAVRVPTRRYDDVVDVDQLGELVDTLSDHAATLDGTVCGVGVVTPGIVDGDLGVVRFAANLGWRNLALRDRLADRTKLPLRIGHDVRSGGLAEFTVGAAVGVRNAMFMPVGTGIAAALMVDGHELNASGFAGEIGHAIVDPSGTVCGCGARGCLETVGSAAAIARRYTERSGEPVRGAQEVADRMRAGDTTAKNVWDEAVGALATALTMAVVLLAPEVIVIGGGLAESGDALFTPLREELDGRLTFHRRPELVPAALGDNAGCTGAGLLGWRAVREAAP
ncbi:MAG TPA: ROK family protein [Actinophytocola sp.]|uniref:ROK family protein n=1 Tax=Actinophytocola sp. TaxID=1872138 RepID=UPI002DDD9D65|nr:ROK family protein [Actinophytocola sp.]HEV2779608.1 ROK family protein [Actinophytocola sp.]